MALYKYLIPDRLDVLENGMLRFTPARALNDPFEVQAYFEGVVPTGWVEEQVRTVTDQFTWEYALSDEHLRLVYEQNMPAAGRALMPFAFFKALTRRANLDEAAAVVNAELNAFVNRYTEELRAFAPQARKQFWEGFQTRFGILCLSATAESELMWSHYADSHRGFVIGFNEQHEWFDRRREPEDDFFRLRSIKYVSERPIHPAMIELDAEAIFWTKNDPWAYEQEWRMVVPLEAPDRQPDRVFGEGEAAVHLFAFPPDAVQEVVLGCRAPAALRTRLRELLSEQRYAHVQLSQAVLDERRGTLSIDRMLPA